MLTIILWVVLLVIVLFIRRPKNIREFYSKYKKLRKVLPRKYNNIKEQVPINIFSSADGHVGYNINKGMEIGICSDGESNEMMHVLIHELAHVTVNEYDHSPKFWANFREIRQVAIDNDLYTPIKQSTEFCGGTIKD